MQSLLILGRQPELGLSELESLYGSDKVILINPTAAVIDVDPCNLAFSRLGGSLKLATVLLTLPTTNWREIIDFLAKTAPQKSMTMPDGKMTLGISEYGFNQNIRQLSTDTLKIKRAILKTGRSVRIVPNKASVLNSAQVIHNKLTSPRSWELLLVKSASLTYIAQTVMVQDIEAYTKRDQARPRRDPRVGMLPPKLAQIIINLASGVLNESETRSSCQPDSNPKKLPKLNRKALDPFCGTGVILQEAYLMGYGLIGSDLEPRMIEYTKTNLSWLASKYGTNINQEDVVVGDARKATWPEFNFIATETNLGKPLTALPNQNELDRIMISSDSLIVEFLNNVSRQTKPGTRIAIAVPTWQLGGNRFKSLPLIDRIGDMGYNFVDFKHHNARQLVYHRPEQITARQLLVITRK